MVAVAHLFRIQEADRVLEAKGQFQTRRLTSFTRVWPVTDIGLCVYVSENGGSTNLAEATASSCLAAQKNIQFVCMSWNDQ